MSSTDATALNEKIEAKYNELSVAQGDNVDDSFGEKYLAEIHPIVATGFEPPVQFAPHTTTVTFRSDGNLNRLTIPSKNRVFTANGAGAGVGSGIRASTGRGRWN